MEVTFDHQQDPIANPLSVVPEPSEKTCTKCERTLPLGNFHRDSTHHDGYRSQCRECKRNGDIEYKKRKRARIEASTIEAQKQELERVSKAKANRNAMLRLISNHRAEFDSLVSGELLRIDAAAKNDVVPKNMWVSANAAS